MLSRSFATCILNRATYQVRRNEQGLLSIQRRWLSSSTESSAATSKASTTPPTTRGWLYSANFWGGAGAICGWGMSISAIYDAFLQGPEVISLTMTPVLMLYSSLFAYWSMVITPKNYLLLFCHVANVTAQSNQLRRGLEHKISMGEQDQVNDMAQKSAVGGAVLVGSFLFGPSVRSALANANMGILSSIAAADAGPFTVHFWAPMSKWLISGASFLELDRPVEKISLAQYTALTLTGFFFVPYSLLVIPINYVLCSVNVALFLSSGWHLGRKIKADFIDPPKE